MTTKVIGVKKFRENVTKIWKEAKEKKIRYIVMYHSKPILEVNPIYEDELIIEKFAADIVEAREQVKKGEVYSQEEVIKELGL